MQRETINHLYEEESRVKAPNYEIFNYVIKNLDSFIDVFKKCEYDRNYFKKYISNLTNANKFLSGMDAEVFQFLINGETHLSFYSCTQKHLNLLTNVYKLSSHGMTTREISKAVGISLTSVVRLHFIAVNYLASRYNIFRSDAISVA